MCNLEATLYAIPLNQTFDARGHLAANAYRTYPSPGTQQLDEGAFFTDVSADTIYSFAGLSDISSTLYSQMSAFNITSNTWSSANVAGGDFNKGRREGALKASTADGMGFFTGGYDDIFGMVVFDSKTMSWKNETSNRATSLSVRGQMVSTGYGNNGTLITIGGYYRDTNVSTESGPNFELRDMSTIGVYDVSSSTWYNVTSTGDIPEDRANFCAAVSAAPDYSR